MKIFLTGEGPTDCGRRVYVKDGYVWEDGPVQVYIHKIISNAEIDTIDKAKMKDLSAERKIKRNQRALKGLDGHSIKAFFVAQIAAEQGYDVAAMYVDADKSAGSTQKDDSSCRKRYELVKEQVMSGLIRGGASKPLAIIPMKMIECWILGDPEAFPKAFGVSPTPALLKNPELIWGNESDPDSDYPKNRLSRVLAECHSENNQAVYVAVAEASNITTLCKNCPISFEDFVNQLMAISAETK